MFNLKENEIEEIDNQLDAKLQWAEENKVHAEQLAMDATRLLSCTSERFDDYKDKGFFKRVISSFSGKTAEMQRDNQNDLISLQKVGWRYLQLLNERDVLMAHSLITIKNNLETLAIEDVKTKDEITRLAIKVKHKFDNFTMRVDEIEITVNLLHWLATIEVNEYEERYTPYLRLLYLVLEFKIRKNDNWTYKDIQCLQQAMVHAKIDRKENITINEFIQKLLDEIDISTLPMFNNMIIRLLDNKDVKLEDILEEISSPIFNSIYLISNKYSDSDIAVEALIENLEIGKEEAIKRIILKLITNAGVDINKELYLQDIALEILSCTQLAKELFEDEESIEQVNINILEETSNIEEELLINEEPILKDLDLSLMPNKISSGSDFSIIITNKGKVKTFGKNNYGCLGIGSNESITEEISIEVLDLPEDIKCISVNAGINHALALFENNELFSWGHSNEGQLGDNTRDDRLSAFKVIGLPIGLKIVKLMATSSSSIVLLENGDIYATGKLTDSLVFKPYELNFKVKDFDVIYDSSIDKALVLLDDNNKIFIKRLEGCSYMNWCDYDKDGFFEPKGLHEDAIITKLISGSCHLHVLTKKNVLYGIGNNDSGEIGVNSRNRIDSFQKIYGIEGQIIQTVANHTYSRYERNFVLSLTDTNLYGFGNNEYNQLGEKDNYRTTHSKSGLIFKDKHTTYHYFEQKPKILKALSLMVNVKEKAEKGDDIEISCDNEVSYLYDYSYSRIYKSLPGNNHIKWISIE